MAQAIPFSFLGQGETLASVEITPIQRVNAEATNLNVEGITTDEGGAPITDKGICWGVDSMPTIGDNFLSSGLTGLGGFIIPITDTEGLNLTTVYYFRAYATNTFGTAYSSQKIQATSVAPFITEWNLPAPLETVDIFNFTFNVTSGGPYSIDAYVDWGDGSAIEYFSGTTETLDIGNMTHEYATSGMKTIEISGIFQQLHMSNDSRLETIEQWGGQYWWNMQQAFKDCVNLDVTATDVPILVNMDLSSYQMQQMFRNCTSLIGTPAFNTWDISNITRIDEMFKYCTIFNQDITNWNTSNVEDMSELFYYAVAFNQDISGWNVSSVTNMYRTFRGTNMTGLDLSSWDVSSVLDMGEIFKDAVHIPIGIDSWNTSAVTDMGSAFNNTSAVIPDITGWDISNVTTTHLASMFAFSTFNQDISGWTLNPSVYHLSSMFRATPFNQDISSWNISNVTSINSMFRDNTAINQDFSTWDISNITDMYKLFGNTTTLSTVNYDAMLIAWEALGPNINQLPDFGTTQYTKAPSAAATAHASLISTYGWTILDGGPTP